MHVRNINRKNHNQKEDCHDNKIQMASAGISLSSPADISLSAKGNVSIEATADVDIKGMNTNVKAEAAFSANGNASAEVKASGEVTVSGAMVMIN